MFSFGENEIYDQVANPEGSLIRRIQNFLQSIFGLAPCLFIGRGVFQYSFGIVPFRKPIYTVGELALQILSVLLLSLSEHNLVVCVHLWLIYL